MIARIRNWFTGLFRKDEPEHKHEFNRARKGQDKSKTHCRCSATREVKRRKKEAKQ